MSLLNKSNLFGSQKTGQLRIQEVFIFQGSNCFDLKGLGAGLIIVLIVVPTLIAAIVSVVVIVFISRKMK